MFLSIPKSPFIFESYKSSLGLKYVHFRNLGKKEERERGRKCFIGHYSGFQQ